MYNFIVFYHRKSSSLSTISAVHSSSLQFPFWFYGQEAGARMLLHCCVLLLLLPSLAKWQKTERVGGEAVEIGQLKRSVPLLQSFGSCWFRLWPLLLPPWDGVGTGAQEKWREGKKHTEFHTLSLGVRHFLLFSRN